MAKVLLIVGTVLFVNGFCLIMRANLTLGVLLTVLLGVGVFCCGLFYRKLCDLNKNKRFRVLRNIFVGAVCAEMLFVGFIAVYGHNDNVDYNEDAVIVLGAAVHGDEISDSLKRRLDAAIEYNKKNSDAVIVVTGGQGFQESVTEASAMEKYLISQGVNNDIIIKEEKATSTNENMRFSKKILDERFEGKYKVAIITNSFHIYRSFKIAHREGLENVTHKYASFSMVSVIPFYIRESLAIFKMWILD